MTIQRYFSSHDGVPKTWKCEDGLLVLYTNHLAALAEKEEKIQAAMEAGKMLKEQRDKAEEQITALTTERDLWKFMAITVAAHLDYKTMSTDIQEWVNEYKKAHESLTARNTDLDERLTDAISKHGELARKYGMLTDENKQLRELVDGAEDIVELYGASRPGLTEGQEGWKKEWLRKARQALRGGEER